MTMNSLDLIRLRAQHWRDHHNGGPVTQAFLDREWLLGEVDRLTHHIDALAAKYDPCRASNEALSRYHDRG